MQKTYHFGVPAMLVWISHILMGILFVYLGYLIIEGKKLDKWAGILLLIIGIVGALYHLHIWFYEAGQKSP
jgi:hypothetical protein